jgi:hypothetical protein
VARIASGLAALLISFIFVGEGIAEGFGPLLRLTARETAMMVAFVIVWIGLLLGWKWELVGGLMVVGGMAAFYLLDYLFSGTFPRGPFFFILASPGLLFLYCGLQSGKEAAAGNV